MPREKETPPRRTELYQNRLLIRVRTAGLSCSCIHHGCVSNEDMGQTGKRGIGASVSISHPVMGGDVIISARVHTITLLPPPSGHLETLQNSRGVRTESRALQYKVKGTTVCAATVSTVFHSSQDAKISCKHGYIGYINMLHLFRKIPWPPSPPKV